MLTKSVLSVPENLKSKFKIKIDIGNEKLIIKLFKNYKINYLVNLSETM